MTYLGHLISSKGVTTDPSKISAIASHRMLRTSEVFFLVAGYFVKHPSIAGKNCSLSSPNLQSPLVGNGNLENLDA
jgi:hypothetical protein